MNALIIGFGSIGRALCTLKLPFKSLVVIDKLDLTDLITKFFKDKSAIGSDNIASIKFVNLKLAATNLDVLKEILVSNKINIMVDCSYNVDTLDLIKILPANVAYINTSVEDWEENDISIITTLKQRQDEIKEWYHKNKPQNNILLDCGMNPGLISLWAYDCCAKFKFDLNDVAQCIVSEVDTQRVMVPRKEKEFVSSWSPDGFMEEVHSPIEGYSLGKYFTDQNHTAYRTISKSLRPSSEQFYGYTVRHAETITMHRLFPNATLMYIYKCPDEAVSSLFEYQIPKPIVSKRIFYSPEIIDGKDELGVLISDNSRLVWYGSLLSNDDIKNYPLGQYLNATSYQVACGLWIGINTLEFYQKEKVSKLMSPEDIIDCHLFEDCLETVSEYLKMHTIEFVNNELVDEFIKNKSFEEHYLKN